MKHLVKNNYGQTQDLQKSNFYKTVQTTLQKNLDKEIAQKKFNTFLSNASPMVCINHNPLFNF